ncbi:interphotoreceptor matrix proteoglycan 2 [Heptranchias perlo]|uniref:interphotoreceptor matrix proteoglycan 2 n=1 Tax=Heptranchias perlo TaxID=212740 RepID=UPI00355A7824
MFKYLDGHHYMGSHMKNCSFGPNSPHREVTLTLLINRTWDENLGNNSSVEYRDFTNKLVTLLTPLFREAAPKNFYKVQVTGLREGSIIANSSGVYNYSNNQMEIDHLNNDLQTILLSIVNTTEALKNFTDSMGGDLVTLTRVYAPPPLINNITGLKFRCEVPFDDYTINCSNGNYCICEGPCKRKSVCHGNGECLNQINGSVCECYQDRFYKYTGKYCETSIRTSAFYGVLFGVLSAGLLLLIVIIIAIIFCCRRRKSWHSDRRTSHRWYSIDEEHFRFQQTDMTTVTPTSSILPLGKRRGRYSLSEHLTFENDFGSGVWRPNLDKVDTEAKVRARRPEMVMPLPDEP